jgi:hypothetical protein
LYDKLVSAKVTPPADKTKDQSGTKDVTGKQQGRDQTTKPSRPDESTLLHDAAAARTGVTHGGVHEAGAYHTAKTPGVGMMSEYPSGPAAGASSYAPAMTTAAGVPGGVGVGQGLGHQGVVGESTLGDKMEAPSATRAAAHTLGQLNLG